MEELMEVEGEVDDMSKVEQKEVETEEDVHGMWRLHYHSKELMEKEVV